MYREALTPEKRIEYRLRNFIGELRKDSLGKYTRESVANVLDDILACELGAMETENEARLDLRELKNDADVEDAVMHEQLERDAR